MKDKYEIRLAVTELGLQNTRQPRFFVNLLSAAFQTVSSKPANACSLLTRRPFKNVEQLETQSVLLMAKQNNQNKAVVNGKSIFV